MRTSLLSILGLGVFWSLPLAALHEIRGMGKVIVLRRTGLDDGRNGVRVGGWDREAIV